jgi:NADH:ubiquinone oxidoreductase subunit 5 (subunit L)/multisubunit Na+/H+ antiporter MnhA subunit
MQLPILSLWGVSCCVILSHFPNIHAIATEILVSLFRFFSQHVSVPTGHLQVTYNITYTIEVPSLLQRIRCSLIVYLCGVSPLISIYSFNYLNFSLN